MVGWKGLQAGQATGDVGLRTGIHGWYHFGSDSTVVKVGVLLSPGCFIYDPHEWCGPGSGGLTRVTSLCGRHWRQLVT